MTDFAGVSWAVFVGSTVWMKASAIVGVAGVMAALLGRSRAATRCAVWSGGVVALLLVPLAAGWMPSWRVEGVGVEVAVPQPLGEVPVAPVARSAPTPRIVVPATTPKVDTRRAAVTAPAVVATAAWETIARVALAVWIAGIAWLGFRLGLDVLRITLVTRRARPATHPAWRHLRDALRVRLGIRPAVRVLVSDDVTMPLSWGIVRPVVILPASASAWSYARIHAVLAHEMAHIARGDYGMHLAAEVVRAVYWLNPLVWWAARQQEYERERACDDAVLRSGTTAPDYARHLVAIARGAGRSRLRGAMAMARSRLRARVQSVMDARRDRRTTTAAVMTAVTATAVGIGVVLGAAEVFAVRQVPMPTAQIVEQLRAGPPDDRRRAAWTLGEREDPAAVDGLIAALDDDFADVRIVAAWALGEIKDARAIDPLARLLTDGQPLVREMAALALGELEQPAAIHILMDAAERDAALTGPVAWALGEIDDADARTARTLVLDRIPAGERPTPETWIAPLERDARQLSGTWDVTTLVGSLESDDPRVRQTAAERLGLLGDRRGVDALLNALLDDDPHVRATAVWALDEINPSEEGR